MAKQSTKMQHSINEKFSGALAGMKISGKTLVIIELGGSGDELAKRAKALGMPVLETKGRPHIKPSVEVDALRGPSDMLSFLSEADFMVVLATLTQSTIGMVGGEELAAVMPSAYLLNLVRGTLVD